MYINNSIYIYIYLYIYIYILNDIVSRLRRPTHVAIALRHCSVLGYFYGSRKPPAGLHLSVLPRVPAAAYGAPVRYDGGGRGGGAGGHCASWRLGIDGVRQSGAGGRAGAGVHLFPHGRVLLRLGPAHRLLGATAVALKRVLTPASSSISNIVRVAMS